MSYRRLKKPRKKKRRKAAPMPMLSDFIDTSKYTHVVGIDEVGWGALAGPIMVSSLATEVSCVSDIKDSKRYSTDRSREKAWAKFATEHFCSVNYTCIDVTTINSEGHGYSLRSATDRLIDEALEEFPAAIVVVDGDYQLPYKLDRLLALPKADSFVPAVSAASVFAKLHRDRIMSDLTGLDEWELFKNKGYGTHHHISMLKKHGPIEGLHRVSSVKNICK